MTDDPSPSDQEVWLLWEGGHSTANCCSSRISWPSGPGGLHEATRHFKECGRTTSYPGDHWRAQELAKGRAHLQASDGASASNLRMSGHPLTAFPLPTALQLLASFSRRFQNPLSKKICTSSFINFSIDNKLLLTLSVPDSFPNQESGLHFSVCGFTGWEMAFCFVFKNMGLAMLRFILETQFS